MTDRPLARVLVAAVLAGVGIGVAVHAAERAVATTAAAAPCPRSAVEAILVGRFDQGRLRIVLPEANGAIQRSYTKASPESTPVMLGQAEIDAIMTRQPLGTEMTAPQQDALINAELLPLYEDWLSSTSHMSEYGSTWALVADDGLRAHAYTPGEAQSWLSTYGCGVTISGTTPSDPVVTSARLDSKGRVELNLGSRNEDQSLTTPITVTWYRSPAVGKAACSSSDWTSAAVRIVAVVQTTANPGVSFLSTVSAGRHLDEGCLRAVVTVPTERRAYQRVLSEGVWVRSPAQPHPTTGHQPGKRR